MNSTNSTTHEQQDTDFSQYDLDDCLLEWLAQDIARDDCADSAWRKIIAIANEIGLVSDRTIARELATSYPEVA